MTYVVVNNIPRHLSEDEDPGRYETLAQAKEVLRYDVARYTDADRHLLDVNWSADGETAFVSYTDRTYDLGHVFEIVRIPDVIPASLVTPRREVEA